MTRKDVLLPMLTLMLVPGALLLPVRAEALRCGGSLVTEGDQAFEVRQACTARGPKPVAARPS